MSFRFAEVSLTKYHKNMVNSSLVTIAAKIFGLTITIKILIKKDHKTYDL